MLKGLQQVAALIDTATWIAGALPKPGEKTRPEVGVVVRRGVGHAVGRQIGDRVKALVQGRASAEAMVPMVEPLARRSPARGSARIHVGLGALAFDARRVDDQVAHDRKPWSGSTSNVPPSLTRVSRRATSASTTLRWREPPLLASRSRHRGGKQATVEVTLHRLEEVRSVACPGRAQATESNPEEAATGS